MQQQSIHSASMINMHHFEEPLPHNTSAPLLKKNLLIQSSPNLLKVEEMTPETPLDEPDSSSLNEEQRKKFAALYAMEWSQLQQQQHVELPPFTEQSAGPMAAQPNSFNNVDEQRNLALKQLFNLPETEQILEDFYCAYYYQKNGIFYQGRLYISPNYVCFYSNIGLGFRKITLVIPFGDVASIERRTAALVVPNAIEIRTKSQYSNLGSVHYFGSFMFRDQTYNILSEIWKLFRYKLKKLREIKKKQKLALIKKQILEDEEYATDNDVNSSDEYTYTTVSDEEEEEEEENEVEERPQQVVVETPRKEKNVIPENLQNKLATDDKKQDTSANNSTSPATKTSTTSASKDATTTTNSNNNAKESSGKKGDDDEEEDKPRSTDKKTDDDEVKIEDENEEEEVIADAIDDISQIPYAEPFYGRDKMKTKEIVSETINLSCVELYKVLYADESKLEYNYHMKRGCKDVVISKWVRGENPFGYTRKVTFVSPVTSPLGPKSTRAVVVQRLIFTKDKKQSSNQQTTHSLDVPYSDSFRIVGYIDVVELSPSQCQLKIILGCMFIKSTLLKFKIEEAVMKETTASYLMWYNLMKEEINAYMSRKQEEKGGKQSASRGEKVKKRKKRSELERRTSIVSTSGTTGIVAPKESGLPSGVYVPPTEDTSSNDSGGLLSMILGTALQFVTENLNTTSILIVFIALFILFLLPQQLQIRSSLKMVNQNLVSHQQRVIGLEQDLNVLFLNMTKLNLSSDEYVAKLKETWQKTRVAKSISSENVPLHSLLYELNQLRKQVAHYKQLLGSSATMDSSTTTATNHPSSTMFTSSPIVDPTTTLLMTFHYQMNLILYGVIALIIVVIVKTIKN